MWGGFFSVDGPGRMMIGPAMYVSSGGIVGHGEAGGGGRGWLQLVCTPRDGRGLGAGSGVPDHHRARGGLRGPRLPHPAPPRRLGWPGPDIASRRRAGWAGPAVGRGVEQASARPKARGKIGACVAWHEGLLDGNKARCVCWHVLWL